MQRGDADFFLCLEGEVRCRNGATVVNKRTSNIFHSSEGKESGVSCIEQL